MKNLLFISATLLALTACVSSDDYDTPQIGVTKVDVKLVTATTPYTQDFTGQAVGKIPETFEWKTIAEKGTRTWEFKTNSSNPYAQMSAFKAGQANVTTWLISPVFDFSTVTDKFISFSVADAFQTGNPLKLKYSTDFTEGNPFTATWTEIGTAEIAKLINNSATFDNKYEPSGDIAVPATGKVVFAFIYEGGDPGITTTIQLDNIKIGQKSGTVTPPTSLTTKTIAEIRALGLTTPVPADTKITGTVISDSSNGSITNLNVVLQDASNAGIVVRFKTATTFAKGDVIDVDVSGLTLTESNGVLQFNQVDNTKATKTGTGTITPQVVTITDLLTNGANYESELVSLQNVSYPAANLSATFPPNGNTVISDGTNNINLFTRTAFSTLTTTVIPSGTGTVTGIVSEFNGAFQLLPRDVTEVTFTTTPPPPVSTNLVQNPSFESDLTGWTLSTTGDAATIDTATPLDGAKVAKHTAATKTSAIYQRIPVTPGESITVSVNYNVLAGDGTDARIWSGFVKADGTSFITLDAATKGLLQGPNNGFFTDAVNSGWHEYKTTVTVPADAAFFNLEVRSYTGSTVLWDKFSVTK